MAREHFVRLPVILMVASLLSFGSVWWSVDTFNFPKYALSPLLIIGFGVQLTQPDNEVLNS
jgi:hypothetical protein